MSCPLQRDKGQRAMARGGGKPASGARVARRIALVGLGLLVLALAFIGLQSMVRGTPLVGLASFDEPRAAPAVSAPDFPATMELFTATQLLPGNDVRVLIDGADTFTQLWRDLRSARRSIAIGMYYIKPGRVADTLKAILVERARAGVAVRFLYDAFGAQNVTDGYVDSLRAAGVRVAVLRPLRWYALHKAQNRSHIRAVVIDGRVGYTGGFGIDDKWYDPLAPGAGWRETNVRFTGPAVAQLHAAFALGWTEATGVLLTGDVPVPLEPAAPARDGAGSRAGVLHATPTLGSTPAERFLALSIAGARRRLYIANSYFVPDDDFTRLLIAAARRGVDVRVLTAGTQSDVALTLWASRARYEPLLEGGVRIYEYRPTMMHAKTLVADGLWTSIGSMNFDNRSLALNEESNLNVLGPAVGALMDSLFMADLQRADEVTLDAWRTRGLWSRVRERVASAVGRLL